MKKLSLLFILLSLSISSIFGQTPSDTIANKKIFGGYIFYEGNRKLSSSELEHKLSSNQKAYTQFKSAQATNIFASILGGVGGFCIGWPIGTTLAGREANWTMAGIGAGLALISIPIGSSAANKIKKATEIYNSGSQTSSFWDNKELRLSLTENGVGLVLHF